MTKIIIFGNSASGKSSLAKTLASAKNLRHLDLDTVAWLPSSSPARMPLAESQQHIERFLLQNENWVIEGCYADLIELVIQQADEIIFLNLPVSACIENAKARPWEPHKYPSKEAQDTNLEMLINWIKQYEFRSDTFSQTSHQALFDNFSGKKTLYTANVYSPE